MVFLLMKEGMPKLKIVKSVTLKAEAFTPLGKEKVKQRTIIYMGLKGLLISQQPVLRIV
eukprot:CAMPEP_0174255234 /NCGR_PEP_ID=MMETSP0439-20130205/4574_1 /TAXON_ID=0 /ORGANISM="Stereomyxa ramosa, Strain Chinc5" /LENGTH=58 /DNA_ID=CAMNT_0015337327 /DNA_START=1125 /DNA_END=1301 /DNA_ORIENTATION=+